MRFVTLMCSSYGSGRNQFSASICPIQTTKLILSNNSLPTNPSLLKQIFNYEFFPELNLGFLSRPTLTNKDDADQTSKLTIARAQRIRAYLLPMCRLPGRCVICKHPLKIQKCFVVTRNKNDFSNHRLGSIRNL